MFEKVNPSHPDKLADRIAGALVDYAYTKEENPRIAVEVLLGHGLCDILIESSVNVPDQVAGDIVHRIVSPTVETFCRCVPQDQHLAHNQKEKFRCGDNGIFKGVPVTIEERSLTELAAQIYEEFPFDGKYVHDGNYCPYRGLGSDRMVFCQSNANSDVLRKYHGNAVINPLGPWTGGPDVDAGATNRKLGSDMGGSVTGGGLHGKDLSKADVSVNIYAWLKAQREDRIVELSCAIGDEYIDGWPYRAIVDIAADYIRSIGGFEKFAEWGLIRPMTQWASQG